MQELTVVKVIAGKLWEAWSLLEKGFFGSGLAKTYEPTFDPETKESLDALKKYFGRATSLYSLRNNYAFHYRFDALHKLPERWDQAPDELTRSPFSIISKESALLIGPSFIGRMGNRDGLKLASRR